MHWKSTIIKTGDIRSIDNLTIKKAAKGDSEAFKQIYDEHSGFLWKVIYRTVNGDQDAASEILNEVFFRIHKALLKYNPDYKFSTWIYKIAVNTTRTYLRKRRQKWEREAGLDEAKVESEKSDEYDQKELVEIILSSLAPEERFLLTALTVEGISFNELAEIVGVSSGSLRTRMSRLKARIRKEFADEC